MIYQPIFLGGITSALLVRCAFQPYDEDFVVWFALVPFLYSLHRHQDRPWLRLTQALGFGLVLVPWMQWWFVEALRGAPPEAEFEATGEIAGNVTVGLQSAAAWAGLVGFIVVFALASGPILRSRYRSVLVCGLPAMWTGLEVLRATWPLSELPFLSGWLTLGCAVDAASPSARIATVLGVYGVSFAAVLTATCFVVALVDRRWYVQLLAVLAGVAVPCVLHSHTDDLNPASDPTLEKTTRVAMLIAADSSPERRRTLASAIGPGEAELAFCPSPNAVEEETQSTLAAIVQPEMAGDTNQGHELPTPAMAEHDQLLVLYVRGPSTEGLHASLHQSASGVFHISEEPGALSPAAGRSACRRGAGLLSVFFDRRVLDPIAHQQTLNLLGFRALESGRWIVYTSMSDAAIIDPAGRAAIEFPPGVDGAGVEEVTFTDAVTPYRRYGWWLEPVCLLAALGIIVSAFRSWRDRSHAR